MRIRVTDSRSGDANQNLERANLRHPDISILQRFSDLKESHRSHLFVTATRVLSERSLCSTNEGSDRHNCLRLSVSFRVYQPINVITFSPRTLHLEDRNSRYQPRISTSRRPAFLRLRHICR